MSDIQAIKFRLVGALVVVVGFACVWWLMLDHEAHRRIKDEQVDIPKQTFSVERIEVAEPKPLNIKPSPEQAELLNGETNENSAQQNAGEVIRPVEMKAVVMDSEPPKPLEAKVPANVEQKLSVQEKPLVKSLPKPAEEKPVEEKPAVAEAKKTGSYSALDTNGLPEAWVLQLASVKSKENAQQLQKKLLASSYPAYVKSVNTADGISYRVLVGPKLSRQRADEMAKSIEKEHHIKSLIIKFKAGYEQ